MEGINDIIEYIQNRPYACEKDREVRKKIIECLEDYKKILWGKWFIKEHEETLQKQYAVIVCFLDNEKTYICDNKIYCSTDIRKALLFEDKLQAHKFLDRILQDTGADPQMFSVNAIKIIEEEEVK